MEEQVTEDHLVVQVIHLLLVHHKVILEEVIHQLAEEILEALEVVELQKRV